MYKQVSQAQAKSWSGLSLFDELLASYALAH